MSAANRVPPSPSRTALSTRQIWAMPVVLTVLSSVALVIGLLADGLADVVAYVGLGIPVVIAGSHVIRAMRAAGVR